MIKESKEKINSAFNKIEIGIEIPVYNCSGNLESDLERFNIKASNIIQQLKESEEAILYKINLKENTKILAYTNSVFYENTNKTLPLGMNIEEAFLLNVNKLNLKEINNGRINIVTFSKPENEISKINVKKIEFKEYAIEE